MEISVLTLLGLNRTRLPGLQAALVNTKDALKKSLRPQQPICAADLIVLMTAIGDASCRLALSKYKTEQLKVERVGHALCIHPHIVPNQLFIFLVGHHTSIIILYNLCTIFQIFLVWT